MLLFEIGIQGDHEDVEKRKSIYGANVIPPKKPKGFWVLVWEALQDTTLIILIIAAVVSLSLWLFTTLYAAKIGFSHDSEEDKYGWIDSVAIIASVAAVCFVTAFNDWSKERQFRGLQSKLDTDHLFSVLRNGVVIQIPNSEIVVGDICQVKKTFS